MAKCFLSILFGAFAISVVVHAQDQSGFISMDCGIRERSSYTDKTTRIRYISDASFIGTGIIESISPEFKTDALEKQFWNVRAFPQGVKNCYTLTPPQVTKGSKYLIRASFMYGNYDGQGKAPEFDIYLGVNMWDSVKLVDASTPLRKEIIHVVSSNYMYVCLVNMGLGTPFISALELRPLKNTTYVTQNGSLVLFQRLDFGSAFNQVRFTDDVVDRIWAPYNSPNNMASLSTSFVINSLTHNDFQLPSLVMGTAIMPLNADNPLKIYWVPDDPTLQFYIYMHFAELEELHGDQSREFNIYLNGDIWYGPVVPRYLYTTTIYSIFPKSAAKLEFSINKTKNSTLPPIINAMEIYMAKQLLQSQTDKEDVDAMMNIKSLYGVKRNWEGDPCAPENYSWIGLNCNYDGYNSPRIISLNLSSSGLTGEIPPYISNLKLIQYLDLSHNSLTGSVPNFLAQLPLLRVLNLTGNKLEGSIPVKLIERSKNGSLSLSVGENPNLCSSSVPFIPCKKKNIVVPIVASLAIFFTLLTALAIFCWLKRREQHVKEVAKIERVAKVQKVEKVEKLQKVEKLPKVEIGPKVEKVLAKVDSKLSSKIFRRLDSKNRQFTYYDILSITNYFQKVIGKGGFGKVFHGHLDGAQVAVKMLSPKSIQGDKQFRAEVKLLLGVHHKKLTSLVGYCDDGKHLGLIYEYMANGSLDRHLSVKNPNVLSYEKRLRIAIDAAEGLEYLHDKPSIVHRDVKPTNILLNENFEAKLGDFGLSRVIPVESDFHVSTIIAGTPGYLDPEYNVSNRLTKKSDVYSFGVVLLEIITSRPAIANNQEGTHVIQWVSFMLSKADIRNIADPRLRGGFDMTSVRKAIKLALACVSLSSIQRPTMRQVVMDLKLCLAMEMARMNKGDETESKN